MVAGIVMPDVVAAILAHLRADSDVLALCSRNVVSGGPPRISTGVPEAPASDTKRHWFMPDYAVLIRRAGGPPASLDNNLHYARIDVRCYGPGASIAIRRRTCEELWRTVQPALCPPAGTGYATSFHASHTIIQRIQPEAAPIPLMEPNTDWALVLCPYLVTYSGSKVLA